MSDRRNNMSETCTVLRDTLAWANALDALPIAHLGEDRVPFTVRRRALLEFGLYVGAPAIDLRLSPHRTLVEPGQLITLNAHSGYAGTPLDDRPLSLWWLSFDVAETTPISGLDSQTMLLTTPVQETSRLVERYRSAFRLYRHDQTFQSIRVKCEVLNLLADLHEAVAGERDPAPASDSIEKAMQLLYSAYTRPDLTREELARAAHLSEAQFGRRFLLEVGMSPMQYVGRLRIARARELLERSRLNVAEVAQASGFSDPFHFSRAFKRAVGVCPRTHRMRHHVPGTADQGNRPD
jgi:AraC-like DNA-binding protein